METKKESPDSSKQKKSLEWGNHNPNLTDDNFIDRKHQKISDQNELLTDNNAPITLSEKESGRDRKGVKEGESPLDTKRGKAF